MLSFSIIKNPQFFHDWLLYHTSMGLKMLLYLDGPLSEKNQRIADNFGNSVICTECSWPDDAHYSDKHYYASRHAINYAYDHKERYLAHFDDDEILYLKVASLTVFEEYLDNSDLKTFVISNYEAVKTLEHYDEGRSFFREETWFERTARMAYWQGKPIGRVDDGIINLESPHRFRDPKKPSDSDTYIPKKYALILHYAMMTFEAWDRKKTTKIENQIIIYGLYLKTMAFLQETRTHEEKKAFYNSQRMRSTYLIDRDPTTVSITSVANFFSSLE